MNNKNLIINLLIIIIILGAASCDIVERSGDAALSIAKTWEAEDANKITGDIIASGETREQADNNQDEGNMFIDGYPLYEDFSDLSRFQFTSTSSFSNPGGKLQWQFKRNGGSQFAYRGIPEFSGDFRLIVDGSIENWSNNCSTGVGIGESLGQGIEIRFGFHGGGCKKSGPFIGASGVDLQMRENLCIYSPNWVWVESGKFYTIELTVTNDNVRMIIDDGRKINGTKVYQGSFNSLWIGDMGDGDHPSCSGLINSISIDPLN